MTKIYWDDEYTGKRWTYGLTYRPVAQFHIPDGWIMQSNRRHPKFSNFGTIDYPFQLTNDQLRSYELKYIPADKNNIKF